MLRNLYLVPVLALFLLPAMAHAQFEAGNWDLQCRRWYGHPGWQPRHWRLNVQLQLGLSGDKGSRNSRPPERSLDDGGSQLGGTTIALLDTDSGQRSSCPREGFRIVADVGSDDGCTRSYRSGSQETRSSYHRAVNHRRSRERSGGRQISASFVTR